MTSLAGATVHTVRTVPHGAACDPLRTRPSDDRPASVHTVRRPSARISRHRADSDGSDGSDGSTGDFHVTHLAFRRGYHATGCAR